MKSLRIDYGATVDEIEGKWERLLKKHIENQMGVILKIYCSMIDLFD